MAVLGRANGAPQLVRGLSAGVKLPAMMLLVGSDAAPRNASSAWRGRGFPSSSRTGMRLLRQKPP
jgi:hypothetical protein